MIAVSWPIGRLGSCRYAFLLIFLSVLLSSNSGRAQETDHAFPWRFEEIAVLETDNPEAGVTELGSVVIDGNGVVSYVNQQSNRVRFRGIHRFDIQGRWLGSISRRGEGPGEFPSARLLSASSAGDLLVQGEPSGRRIVRLNADGGYEHSFRSPVLIQSPHLTSDGGGILGPDRYVLISSKNMYPGDPTGDWVQTISTLDPDGTILHSTVYENVNYSLLIPVTGRTGQFHAYLNPAARIAKWTVDAAGGVWIIPPGNDRLQEYSAEGELISDVHIDLDPPEWSAREWRELLDGMTAYRRIPDSPRTEEGTDLIVEELRKLRREVSAIQRFWWVGDEGFLIDRQPFDLRSPGWQKSPGRYLALFSDGTVSEEIDGPGGLVAVSHGFALSLHTDDDDLPILTLYRLVPEHGEREER
ncbi:hypothetical protein ACFL6R_00270 [Gemmatimonadota bacterium]